MDDKFWDFMKDIDWAGKSVKIEKLLLGKYRLIQAIIVLGPKDFTVFL